MTYIWHVALGAGMGTPETRDHLTDADIEVYRAHVGRALAQPMGDPVPGHQAYALSAQNIGGVLLGSVGRRSDALALCTFAVVRKAKIASKIWQGLHRGYTHFAASIGDVPRVPYCAVRAEFGLSQDLQAGAWLDAYQIAVAWAWIEGRNTQ